MPWVSSASASTGRLFAEAALAIFLSGGLALAGVLLGLAGGWA